MWCMCVRVRTEARGRTNTLVIFCPVSVRQGGSFAEPGARLSGQQSFPHPSQGWDYRTSGFSVLLSQCSYLLSPRSSLEGWSSSSFKPRLSEHLYRKCEDFV